MDEEETLSMEQFWRLANADFDDMTMLCVNGRTTFFEIPDKRSIWLAHYNNVTEVEADDENAIYYAEELIEQDRGVKAFLNNIDIPTSNLAALGIDRAVVRKTTHHTPMLALCNQNNIWESEYYMQNGEGRSSKTRMVRTKYDEIPKLDDLARRKFYEVAVNVQGKVTTDDILRFSLADQARTAVNVGLRSLRPKLKYDVRFCNGEMEAGKRFGTNQWIMTGQVNEETTNFFVLDQDGNPVNYNSGDLNGDYHKIVTDALVELGNVRHC